MKINHTWLGPAAPALYIIVVVFVAAMRSEYSHVSQLVSELGEQGGAYSLVMNVGAFITPGLILVVFSMFILNRYSHSVWSRLGTLCITLYGIGLISSGLNPCELSCAPDVYTQDQLLHDLSGTLAFGALVTAPVFWGVHLRKYTEMKTVGQSFLVLGIVAMVLLAVMGAAFDSRYYIGLIQRSLVGTLFLWLIVFSFYLPRFHKSERLIVNEV